MVLYEGLTVQHAVTAGLGPPWRVKPRPARAWLITTQKASLLLFSAGGPARLPCMQQQHTQAHDTLVW